MIVDYVLGFLNSILGPLSTALPTVTVPDALTSGMGNVGALLHRLDYYVPIVEPLHAMYAALAGAVPAVLAFAVGVWVYRRVRG